MNQKNKEDKKSGQRYDDDEETGSTMSPFSQALQARKEELYDKIHVSVRTMDVIVWVTAILLGITVIVIILDAAGVINW